MAERKSPIDQSAYNHQQLGAEDEFSRRRHLSYTRSQRAAAEALQRIRQETGGSPQYGDKKQAPGQE
jgi:hypothetical protein